jgi:hypothetical protein
VGAVTWNRYDMADRVYPNSILSAAPYGGTKHTRWARRLVDGMWYVLGGDYPDTPGFGSGSNILWRVDPTTRPFTFTQLNSYIPASGQKIPAHVDEAPWMYDTKRDRFLLYPKPRWPKADTPGRGRWTLDELCPVDNTWTDLGTRQIHRRCQYL